MSSHWTARSDRGEVLRLFENDQGLRTFADRDLVADLALEGRDVDLAAVDLNVTVTDDLTSLAAAHREAEAVGDVVEAGLKLLEQQFAGDAGLVRGLLVVGAELRLEGEVDALGLLLLAKLQTVADDLLHLAGLAVLAWGEVALLDGAFLGEALGSLEEELWFRRGGRGGRRVLCNVPFLITPDFGCRSLYTLAALRHDPVVEVAGSSGCRFVSCMSDKPAN